MTQVMTHTQGIINIIIGILCFCLLLSAWDNIDPYSQLLHKLRPNNNKEK